MRSREILGWLVAAGLLVAVVSAYTPRGETISGAVRVVDGDSLHVGATEVRLFGVDAFEGRQLCVRDGDPWRCGEAAANELRTLTTGRAITCDKRDTDSYGRTVAVCSNGTVDVGAELARAGLALAYREFSDDYVDEENEAELPAAVHGRVTSRHRGRLGDAGGTRNRLNRKAATSVAAAARESRATSAETAASGSITRVDRAVTKKPSLTSPTASAGSARRKTHAAPDGGRAAKSESATTR